MSDTNGIVYVFSNPAMPNIVKIGMTSRETIDNRLRELSSSTGVPVPFECEFACRVNNCSEVESALHLAFDPYRINPKREFFKIKAEQAVAILKLLSVDDITTSVASETEKLLDPIDVSSGKKLKNLRRPSLDFEEMGIAAGSRLDWNYGEYFVTVSSNKKVIFKGTETSLTAITQSLLGKPYAVKPTSYWSFDGKNLQDIYEDVYGENDGYET